MSDKLRAAHKPDIEKIPRSLRSLNWLPMRPDMLWEDGSTILAAAPAFDRTDQPDGRWHYELAVGAIRCDGQCFALEVNGELWDWDCGEFDWYVEITK